MSDNRLSVSGGRYFIFIFSFLLLSVLFVCFYPPADGEL